MRFLPSSLSPSLFATSPQGSVSNQARLGDAGGIDLLLTCVAQYKSKDPAPGGLTAACFITLSLYLFISTRGQSTRAGWGRGTVRPSRCLCAAWHVLQVLQILPPAAACVAPKTHAQARVRSPNAHPAPPLTPSAPPLWPPGEEEEYMQNCFDVLCACLMQQQHKQAFVKVGVWPVVRQRQPALVLGAVYACTSVAWGTCPGPCSSSQSRCIHR